MLAKTLFASAASVAVLTLAAVSFPAMAQKAPANAPAPAAAPAAAPIADDVMNEYKALAADMGLKDNQKAAFDAYTKAVGKVVTEHEKWHEKFGLPPRGDRQARFKFHADHQQFRAGQFETLAAARAELVKNLTGDQIALLDEMEDGYLYGPGMRLGRGAAAGPGPRFGRGPGDGPGPRFGRGPGPDPRFDGGPAGGLKPGKHYRRDWYGPGYGPGCGWGPGYGPHGGWGHGWGHGWGYGPGYGPGCNWNGCPWR